MTRKNLRSKKTENVVDDINKNDLSNEESEEEDFYNVERILDKKTLHNGSFRYLIKWEGYPDSQNTWEPLDNLSSVKEMVDEFEDLLREKGKEKYSLEALLSTGKNDSGNKQNVLNTGIYKPKKANILLNDDEETYSDLSKTQKRKKILEENEEINLLGKIQKEYQKDQDLQEDKKERDGEDDGKGQLNIETQINQSNIERQMNEDKTIDKNIKYDKKIENFTNKKEIKGRPKKKILPLEGHFKYRDKPKEILSVRNEKDTSLRFRISWYSRPDGIIPLDSSFSNDQLREYDPLFLLDFYESKIVLCSKRKRSNSENPNSENQNAENPNLENTNEENPNEENPNPENDFNLDEPTVIAEVNEKEKNYIEFLPKPNESIQEEEIEEEESKTQLNKANLIPIDNRVFLQEEQPDYNTSEKKFNSEIKNVDQDYTDNEDKSKDISGEYLALGHKSKDILVEDVAEEDLDLGHKSKDILVEDVAEEDLDLGHKSKDILAEDVDLSHKSKDISGGEDLGLGQRSKDILADDIALSDKSLNCIEGNIPTEMLA